MKIRQNKENKLELYQSSKPVIVISILIILTFLLFFSNVLGISQPLTYALALAILVGIGLISALLPINQTVSFDKENHQITISTNRLIGKKTTQYKFSDVKNIILKSTKNAGSLSNQIFLLTKRKKLIPLSNGYSSNTKQNEENFYSIKQFMGLTQ